MTSANLAYVTPQLVSWAIDRSGLSYAKLRNSLGVSQDEIKAWEQGDAFPPFSKAIHLAKLLHIPFGYLFLDSPPLIEVPLPDFRTLPSTESPQPSVDFLELLYSVLAKHEWYREYAEEQGAEKLSFVSSFTTKASPERVAADIRRTLGIDKALREEADSLGEYLSLLAASAESVGILVMRSGVVGNDTTRPLSVSEFQGFAITDEIAPLVFVNARDFRAAQIFTLAHELAHIWIGTSGISNPNETDVAEAGREEEKGRVEQFCNAVAAEVLVPKSEFLSAWGRQQHQTPIDAVARHFRVSTTVILRRAYELDAINRNQFFALLKEVRSKQTAKRPSSGGDYYRNLRSRHSSRFIEALLGDVRQGGTVYRDAARLMGMKVPTLVSFMESSK